MLCPRSRVTVSCEPQWISRLTSLLNPSCLPCLGPHVFGPKPDQTEPQPSGCGKDPGLIPVPDFRGYRFISERAEYVVD